MTQLESVTFIGCLWECEKCRKAGLVDVWPYPDETPSETAIRFASWTRGRCVHGCLYVARVDKSKVQV